MSKRLKTARFKREEAQSIFDDLSQAYRIVAPVERPGKGRFSDTNLLAYDEVNGFDEIEFFEKTSFSAKDILFPIRETIFTFQDDKIKEANDGIDRVIVFLRSCDIHAIEVTDAHFLKDGGYEDIYYKRRRERVKFFLIECGRPFENCFCVSSGTNRTDDYSVFMRKTDLGYEVEIKDEEFGKYFPNGTTEINGPEFAQSDTCAVDMPEDIDVSIFDNDIWKEYTLRCIACGRCNISCPTCTCFTVQDIVSEDKAPGKRRRIWSSCQVKKFALLSGDHDFRVKNGDRMRYRVLHKISDFKKRHGFNMCVGCGRCDDVCPEYISMYKCIEKINYIIEARKKHG